MSRSVDRSVVALRGISVHRWPLIRGEHFMSIAMQLKTCFGYDVAVFRRVLPAKLRKFG